MNPVSPTPLSKRTDLPVGPTVAEELAKVHRAKGLEPPTIKSIDDLPAWTEEEADAFERAINETCERIDEIPKWL